MVTMQEWLMEWVLTRARFCGTKCFLGYDI